MPFKEKAPYEAIFNTSFSAPPPVGIGERPFYFPMVFAESNRTSYVDLQSIPGVTEKMELAERTGRSASLRPFVLSENVAMTLFLFPVYSMVRTSQFWSPIVSANLTQLKGFMTAILQVGPFISQMQAAGRQVFVADVTDRNDNLTLFKSMPNISSAAEFVSMCGRYVYCAEVGIADRGIHAFVE